MENDNVADNIYKELCEILETQDQLNINCLMRSGVSITKPGPDGVSLLDLAKQIYYTRHKIIPLTQMLDYFNLDEIDLQNKQDISLLFTAVEIGFMSFICKWVRFGLPLNIVNSDGESPLIVASRTAFHIMSARIISYMMLNGADPCISNKEGITPLHCIVSCHRGEHTYYNLKLLIFLLTRAGANINCQDSLGRTPLHCAKMARNYSCVFYLLQFGANIDIVDIHGQTVMDYIFDQLNTEGCISGTLTESSQLEQNLYESTRILMYHIIKMDIVGLHVSDRVNLRFQDLRIWFDKVSKNKNWLSDKYKEWNLSTDDIHTFMEQCKIEKTKLKNVKLDNSNSFFEIILKSDLGMYKVLKKDIFVKYFSSGNHRKDFPIYWYFLQLRYNAGLIRREIQDLGQNCFQLLNSSLPSTCLDYIDNLFKNEELMKFIETMSSLVTGVEKNYFKRYMILDEKQYNVTIPSLSELDRILE